MSEPAIHRYRHECMATTFEVRIASENEAYARQAAGAAFAVADRLERLLSRFRDDSEVSQIRLLPAGGTLRLSADTFHCLQIAAEMQALTGGAFDPGLGEQMDVQRGTRPPAEFSDGAGRGRLLMDPESFTVQIQDGSVMLDLGAIGKGFAIDRMAEEFAAWDIDSALLVAGGSSILALDGPANSSGWQVAIAPPTTISLCRRAIGASGTAVLGAHILDPRTGRPTPGPLRAWAVHPSAAVADALSTAWMLLTREEIAEICQRLPGTEAFLQRDVSGTCEAIHTET